MDRRTAIKAPTNLFGLLPDTVLLLILKNGCDEASKQAAYKSCKYIRDFCRRNMKSFTLDLRHMNISQAVQEPSSITMCPKTAYGIEALCIRCDVYWEDHTFSILTRLIHEAFDSPNKPTCRSKQLANVKSLDLQLPSADGMTVNQSVTVSRLLSQFRNLQYLRTNITKLWKSLPHLKQLACTSPITPETLQLFAKLQPSIQTLEFVCGVCVFDTFLRDFKSTLSQFTALSHLSLESGHTRTPLTAGTLTSLTQLSTLTLHYVTIQDVHLLKQLRITHPFTTVQMQLLIINSDTWLCCI